MTKNNFTVLLADNLVPPEFELPKRLPEIGAANGLSINVVSAEGNSEEELLRLGQSADIVVVFRNKFNRRVANALKGKCRLVIKPAIGYDQIDVDACSDNGIAAANVPAYCTEEVADHTVALYLSVARYLIPRNAAIKNGGWRIPDPYIPRLSEVNFGILGFGRIAQAVADRIIPFVNKVIAYDPYLPDSIFEKKGVLRADSIENLLPYVQGLSINLPLTNETNGLINRKTLAMMDPKCIIVNTGRGPIINENDLCDAIEAGKILGAGLDVHEIEPLPEGSRLRGLDRVVLTAHQGSYSDKALKQLADEAIMDIIRACKGEPVMGLLNGAALSVSSMKEAI